MKKFDKFWVQVCGEEFTIREFKSAGFEYHTGKITAASADKLYFYYRKFFKPARKRPPVIAKFRYEKI